MWLDLHDSQVGGGASARSLLSRRELILDLVLMVIEFGCYFAFDDNGFITTSVILRICTSSTLTMFVSAL